MFCTLELGIDAPTDQSLHDVDGMTALHWSVQRHDTRALQVNIHGILYCDIYPLHLKYP